MSTESFRVRGCASRITQFVPEPVSSKYGDRKAAGLCVLCGKNPADSGFRCSACVEKTKAYTNSRRDRLKANGLCLDCTKPIDRDVGSRCQRCADLVTASTSARFRRLKDEVYNHYGGYRCACCKETREVFLQLDHINNDGNRHRKEIGDKCGQAMYYWIRDNNFPALFQVLCANCNFGKRMFCVCPHQLEQQALTDGGCYVI